MTRFSNGFTTARWNRQRSLSCYRVSSIDSRRMLSLLLALCRNFTRTRWIDVSSRTLLILADTFEVIIAGRPRPISLGEVAMSNLLFRGDAQIH